MNKPYFSDAFALDATAVGTRRPWLERGHNALWLLAALWIECVLVWMVWHWSSFAHLEFRDPDDALRLMQVRDFIAGQGWFDVSQHRVNPPTGGPMHWSRLLDLPIAGIIVGLRPLLGDRLAEIVACVAVPPLTLLAMCLAVYASVRRFLGVHRTLLTLALLVTSFPILTQMAPLRIDHHAWQVVASVGVLGGMLTLDPRKGGWIAGASMAMWLHISGEALPYVAIYGAVFGLRYVARPQAEWSRFIRFIGTLAFSSAVLLIGTKGLPGLETHCDSMSPPYLLPLIAMFPVLLVGHRLLGDSSITRRVIPLGAGAVTAAVALVAYAPKCLSGPFEALDPLVYDYWYLAIMEGQPIWKQDFSTAAIVLVPGLLGLVGMIGAVMTEKDVDKRFTWLSILGMALGAFAVSIMVLRAVSVAHLLMLIGNIWIIARLYPRIAALPTMATRVVLTVALSVLSPFGGTAIASAVVSAFANTHEDETETKVKTPRPYQEIEALNGLPKSLLFAPLDVGPEILLRTQHSIIATGHHRNIIGMTEVIRAFALPPEAAKAIVLGTRADYLLLFPDTNEIQRYKNKSPHGLAAQLMNGKATPAWLKRVHVKGEGTVQIYRIVRDRTPSLS